MNPYVDEPAGTIVWCSRDENVPPAFTKCLSHLAQVHPDARIVHMMGNDVADLRNRGVMAAGGEWIWFIDTDMTFDPFILKRLLANNVAVVQPLVLKRLPPHAPVLWTQTPLEQDEKPTGRPRLVEVTSIGAGGTLYRRAVFEAIEGPWFEGIIGTEDTSFAAKILKAGFKLYVDQSSACGHMTTVAVWPAYDERTGEWFIKYELPGGGVVIPFKSKATVIRPQLVGAK